MGEPYRIIELKISSHLAKAKKKTKSVISVGRSLIFFALVSTFAENEQAFYYFLYFSVVWYQSASIVNFGNIRISLFNCC